MGIRLIGDHPPYVVAGQFILFTRISQKDDELDHVKSVEEGLNHDKMDVLPYDERMFNLVFFVPSSHLEEVKAAVFKAGAGTIGFYEACSFQVQGVGQFKPLAGSTPFLGSTGSVEYVDEWRVEVVVPDATVTDVITALLPAHPYETPAYHLYRALTLEDFDEHS